MGSFMANVKIRIDTDDTSVFSMKPLWILAELKITATTPSDKLIL